MKFLKVNKKYFKVIAVVLAVLIGLSIFYWQVKSAKAANEELWGMADAKEVYVHSKTSGRVVDLYVKEGTNVQKGQVLAKIDQDVQKTERSQTEAALRAQYAQLQQAKVNTGVDKNNLQAAVNSAAAKVRQANTSMLLAQKEENRYCQLLNQGAVSAQIYDAAAATLKNQQAAYEDALAGLETAQSNMGKNKANQELERMYAEAIEEVKGKLDSVKLSEEETIIRAPFDGIITKKYVEEGSMIGNSIPLFAVQDTTNNWVEFNIKETEINKYELGDAIIMQGRDGNLRLYGNVESISRKADYATVKATNERGDKDIVTFELRVRTNSDQIWPGMRFKLLQG
ncbi:MAG: HlyD family secretion protein [Acidaminococcaceae bacterium]